MCLDKFYQDISGKVQISRQQASDFAKQVADDFNPLHDPDGKRFCVPGDLLFALLLNKYGLSQQMYITFSGMVTDEVKLTFPTTTSEQLDINGENDKTYLKLERSGAISTNEALIESLTQAYVAFSGRTFPHILIPLLAEQQVMINPDRPLVMYERMSIRLSRLDITSVTLESTAETLEIKGKRGNVCLKFSLMEAGETVGDGEKHMIVSGLRPHDADKIAAIISRYHQLKQQYS